ncbi:MAG: hypothetical protein QME70_07825 [Bacillota bacterium]|nr:hypothetical protein [Bacillota bacterium]
MRAVKVTFEARIRDVSLYPLLEAFAALFGCVERALFRDHYVRGEPLSRMEEVVTFVG